MRQPEGYIEHSFLNYKLRKSLYGLKQSPREWYANMDAFLMSHKFKRCKYYCNFCMQQKWGLLLIIILYVDDLLITTSSVAILRGIKSNLNEAFSMTDIGLLRNFIGLKVIQKIWES